MKRRFKILILTGILLLMVLGAYFFRNQWVGYLLSKEVFHKSKGKISLAFDQLKIDVFQKKLSFYAPCIDYHDVYINRKDSVLLKRSSFDKVIISNISLWDFIKNGQIICDQLQIEKPDFIIKSPDSLKQNKASSFDPGSVIGILRDQKITTINFQFLIKHTRIDFGKIQLVQRPKASEFGSMDYSISIANLGTPLATTNDSMNTISYEKLEIKIRNLKRHSIKNNLEVVVDSAYYSSLNKRLIVNGCWFKNLRKPLGSNPQIDLRLNWIELKGLPLNNSTNFSKDIHFKSLKLIGGSITLKDEESHKRASKELNSKELNKYLKGFDKISIDTLIGKHIHLFQLTTSNDTILMLKRLNFDMSNTWASIDEFIHPLKSIHFDSLSASIGQLKFYEKGSGFEINSKRATYDNTRKILVIEQGQATRTCLQIQKQIPVFSATKILIRNLSAKKFQKASKQILTLELSSPDLQIDLDSICSNNRWLGMPPLLLPLKFTRISVEGGNISIDKENKQLDVHGIHLFVAGLEPDRLFQNERRLVFDTLFFEAINSSYLADLPNQNIKSSRIKWQDNKLSIRQFRFEQDSGSNSKQLFIPALSFTHLRLNDLLFHNKMIAGGAYFYKPELQILSNHETKHSEPAVQHWNHFEKFPIKIHWSYLRINQGQISYQNIRDNDSLQLSMQLDIQLRGLKIGYNKQHLITPTTQWEGEFQHVVFKKNKYFGSLANLHASSKSNELSMHDFSMHQKGLPKSKFYIHLPEIQFRQMELSRLTTDDSLIFNGLILNNPEVRIDISHLNEPSALSPLTSWKILYDSINVEQANFQISKYNDSSALSIHGKLLNIFYHPMYRHPATKLTFPGNLLSRWDVFLGKLKVTDTLKGIQMIADRIALQSKGNKLHIHNVVGTNFSGRMSMPGSEEIFGHLQMTDVVFSNLQLSSLTPHNLHIGFFEVPHIWLNILNEKTKKTSSSYTLFQKNSFKGFATLLNSIQIDTSNFADVSISYHYQNRKKLINVNQLGIHTSDIQLGSMSLSQAPHYLFNSMLIDLKGKSVISGDSLYTFLTKDIRINLPEKSIRFDSIIISPRFEKNLFFKKSIYQTDRVTVYGKSIAFNNFDLNSILKNNRFHFGSVQFDNFNALFQRDKRFPLGNKIKPLPIAMLKEIPFKFYVDSIQLLNNQISYYEYNAKASQPGIFFIDNFNMHILNVTNDIKNIDSSLVLKFSGTGRLMNQSNLNFVLVMPYFAADNQFWFSGQTDPVDLSQFNSLTENTMGISVKSGKGNVEIPFITGNNSFVKGDMFFLYKNLKLRLYSRKKAQMNKGIGSPFVNFMLNNLMIRSNNSSFLKHPRKGIIYYERDPHKSFINYIWKSSLSGLLSTLGFNNKQQRVWKREDKKSAKQQKK